MQLRSSYSMIRTNNSLCLIGDESSTFTLACSLCPLPVPKSGEPLFRDEAKLILQSPSVAIPDTPLPQPHFINTLFPPAMLPHHHDQRARS